MPQYQDTIRWRYNADISVANIGIDTADERAEFDIEVALIPSLIADLIRVAAYAERERHALHPSGYIAPIIRFLPEQFGGSRNSSDGHVDLIFHVGGAPITIALQEDDARTMASALQKLVESPWKRETQQ